MTHIVEAHVKTKKQLREMLTSTPERVVFHDPSSRISGEPAIVEAHLMPVGKTLYCTNHPKRSWFARVTKTHAGFKIV